MQITHHAKVRSGAKSRQKPPACAACRYFVQDGEDSFCHRHPPQTMLRLSGDLQVAFPFVKPEWWCGEWSKAALGKSTS